LILSGEGKGTTTMSSGGVTEGGMPGEERNQRTSKNRKEPLHPSKEIRGEYESARGRVTLKRTTATPDGGRGGQ